MLKSYLQRHTEAYDDIRTIIDDQAVRAEVWRVTNEGVTDPGFANPDTGPVRVDIIKGRLDEQDESKIKVTSSPGDATQQYYVFVTTSQNVQQNDTLKILGKDYIVDAISDGQESYTEAILRRLR